MSLEVPGEARSREPADLSQPSTSRRPSSQFRIAASVAAFAAESPTPVVVRSLRSGRRAVPALMDLALPRVRCSGFSVETSSAAVVCYV